MDAISLWCGALLTLLLCDPASLYDLSLQLSFGAAWGLIAFSAPLQDFILAPLRVLEPKRKPDEPENAPQVLAARQRIQRAITSRDSWISSARKLLWIAIRGLAGVSGISLAAHIGTLPILLYAFGTLSLGSLLANLPIVPLSALLVMLGGASLLLPLRPLHLVNYHLADGTARVVGVVASWRSAWLEAPPLSLIWTLALGVLALCGACALGWPRLLFATRRAAIEDDNDDINEQVGARGPSPLESALLWQASLQALRKAVVASAIWLWRTRPSDPKSGAESL